MSLLVSAGQPQIQQRFKFKRVSGEYAAHYFQPQEVVFSQRCLLFSAGNHPLSFRHIRIRAELVEPLSATGGVTLLSSPSMFVPFGW